MISRLFRPAPDIRSILALDVGAHRRATYLVAAFWFLLAVGCQFAGSLLPAELNALLMSIGILLFFLALLILFARLRYLAVIQAVQEHVRNLRDQLDALAAQPGQ